ncbi:MAG TPA: TCR/Tet family MFS transporter [Gemmatimonadaceae bacterium]|nr:TCR/Tet family MFS transporter [Gemmatimonadaceae bacterium]
MRPNGPPAPRAAALAFIFVTVVLDVVAMGIIIPVLPKLIESFLHGDTAHAASLFGVFATTGALMAFVCSPFIGVLSDRFGRRKVILLSNFALGLDYIVMALAPTVGWLFLGRVISGITGATWSTAGAYIADVTTHEKRASGFGLLGAAFGLGFVLGPALGGLLGAVDPRLPFWAAAGMTLVNALYGLLVLPESLPPEKRKAFAWRRANPVGSLVLLRSHRELFGLSAVHFIYFTAHNVMPSVFVLYAGYRYGWNARAVGLTLALVGVCTMIVQGALVKPVVAKLGERRALLTGLAFGTVSLLIWGLAPRGVLGLVAVPFGSLMGFYGPAAQGLMSHRVSPSEQGQLQGALASITGVTGMIAPPLFTQTFARFIGPQRAWHLPGAPFLLASLLTVSALVLAWRVTRVRAEAGVPQPAS